MDEKNEEDRDTPVIDMAPLLAAWRESEQQCFAEREPSDAAD